MNAQASLFERPAPAPRQTVELRPYQLEALAGVDDVLSRVRSALIVGATGTGKTTTFAEAIRRRHREGPALVIAHRQELIDQAARRIRMQTGLSVGVEKAERYAERDCDVVVASVQTLGTADDRRLKSWRRDHFKLVVVDEAHHAIASSYRRILDWFETAKVLGVTATPDRADEQAMGQVFDEVAHIYEIGDAIADGYLCRIRARFVHCEAVDLSSVHTVAGDLNQGELEMVMSSEAALHQVARPTLELAGDRPTVAFTTSVANAHRLAEVFNRYRTGCARAVDGETDDTTRRRLLNDYDQGRFQFIVNVGVLTEGWDCPRVACVAMGRPTSSRSLYAQCVGRGTRVFPGKEDLLVLDFVGNAGKHKLVSAADVLGGKYPEDVVAAAAAAVEKDPGKDVAQALADAQRAKEERQAALERAREEDARRRAGAKTTVRYTTQEVDPFGVLDIERPKYSGRFGDEVASEKQVALLQKWKVPLPENVSKRDANRLIGECIERGRRGECTFAQAKTLAKYGYPKNATRAQARALLDGLAANQWRRLPQELVAAILHPPPGSEG
ncbi:MAG: DEAD/DEAH box helicase [Frankia sp.]|nr:DEAD/DEAH box helicase [Frankia sp.]